MVLRQTTYFVLFVCFLQLFECVARGLLVAPAPAGLAHHRPVGQALSLRPCGADTLEGGGREILDEAVDTEARRDVGRRRCGGGGRERTRLAP